MKFTAHSTYLRYVLRHKWFVLLAGLKLGVPLVALLTHDWSKFLPSEWCAYVAYQFGEANPPHLQAAFDVAWNHHQKRQPHHWTYWLLIKNYGETTSLPMPERYVREMVADWVGAGRATGKPDTVAWYLDNKDKMILHPDTRAQVEALLGVTP